MSYITIIFKETKKYVQRASYKKRKKKVTCEIQRDSVSIIHAERLILLLLPSSSLEEQLLVVLPILLVTLLAAVSKQEIS